MRSTDRSAITVAATSAVRRPVRAAAAATTERDLVQTRYLADRDRNSVISMFRPSAITGRPSCVRVCFGVQNMKHTHFVPFLR